MNSTDKSSVDRTLTKFRSYKSSDKRNSNGSGTANDPIKCVLFSSTIYFYFSNFIYSLNAYLTLEIV